MIEISTSRALRSVPKLYKQHIKRGSLNCICQVGVWYHTLRRARNVVVFQSISRKVAFQRAYHGSISTKEILWLFAGSENAFDIKVESVYDRLSKRAWSFVCFVHRAKGVPQERRKINSRRVTSYGLIRRNSSTKRKQYFLLQCLASLYVGAYDWAVAQELCDRAIIRCVRLSFASVSKVRSWILCSTLVWKDIHEAYNEYINVLILAIMPQRLLIRALTLYHALVGLIWVLCTECEMLSLPNKGPCSYSSWH